jgi:hypothetical protein
MSVMLHDNNSLPSETVLNQLLKKEAERILNPLRKISSSYDDKVEYLGNYQAGKSVMYDINNYDHAHKLSNVNPGTILYPVRAEFAVAREKSIEQVSVTFLCYKDSFGTWTCSWISGETIGEIKPEPSSVSSSSSRSGLLLGAITTIGMIIGGVIAVTKKKPDKPM